MTERLIQRGAQSAVARQPNEGGQCAGHERFFVPAEQKPRKELVTG